MRLHLALLLTMATSTHIVNGINASDDALAQVCLAYDNEGRCTQENDIETACADKDEKCATYVEEGACAANRGYMTHSCAASCNTCNAVIEAAKGAVTKLCIDGRVWGSAITIRGELE